MPRYIDADKLIKDVGNLHDCYNGFSDTYDKACIIGLVEEQPTADVVEVVRCNECKWWKSNFTWNGKEVKVCVKEPYEPVRKENYFCADGERREDG